LTTVAMRNVNHTCRAASGVLNTVRQWAARSEAVIGAVLQKPARTQLHDQAVAYASQVPPGFAAPS